MTVINNMKCFKNLITSCASFALNLNIASYVESLLTIILHVIRSPSGVILSTSSSLYYPFQI